MKKRIVRFVDETRGYGCMRIQMDTTLVYEPSFFGRLLGWRLHSKDETWYSEVGVTWYRGNGDKVSCPFMDNHLEDLYESFKVKKQIFGKDLAS